MQNFIFIACKPGGKIGIYPRRNNLPFYAGKQCVPSSIKGLELGRKGTIAVNDNMQSSIPTIYAGGDIVRGGATVILAMGDGRKAAAAMNEQLKN